MIGDKARELFDKRAKERQVATLKKGSQKPVGADPPTRASQGRARAAVGKAAGVSEKDPPKPLTDKLGYF